MVNWMLLWKGHCRAYFNAKEDAPLIWSVDDGNIENEYKVSSIAFLLPGAVTSYRTEDMPEQPKVWFEHVSCAVYMNEQKEIRITFK